MRVDVARLRRRPDNQDESQLNWVALPGNELPGNEFAGERARIVRSCSGRSHWVFVELDRITAAPKLSAP